MTPLRRSTGLLLALWAGAVGFAQPTEAGDLPIVVPPSVETQPIPHGGDAADDICIWVHPTIPEQSLVIGTDKQGGLAVYNLSGRMIHYFGGDRYNNVDLRTGFTLSGESITLITAGNRSRSTLSAFRIDLDTKKLVLIGQIPIGIYPVGSCMYRSAVDETVYAFVNSYAGEVEQWRLFDRGNDTVGSELVRSFRVDVYTEEQLNQRWFAATEGCVADDETGYLYLAEEDVALWKYHAEPGRDDAWRTMVRPVGEELDLKPDIEGLALYNGPDGTGYLLVSNQTEDEFVVLRREGNHEWVGRFRIGATDQFDEVTHTDGIDVSAAALGAAFPYGVFIAQDDDNRPMTQNFKLVRWDTLADAFDPPLRVNGREPPGWFARTRKRIADFLFGD